MWFKDSVKKRENNKDKIEIRMKLYKWGSARWTNLQYVEAQAKTKNKTKLLSLLVRELSILLYRVCSSLFLIFRQTVSDIKTWMSTSNVQSLCFIHQHRFYTVLAAHFFTFNNINKTKQKQKRRRPTYRLAIFE